MRTCKICKSKFEPQYNSVQMVCSVKCSHVYAKLQKEKRWKKERKQLKEKLKTLSDYKKEAQTVFNAYIRLRDKILPCISCGRHHKGQYHAGHYRSVGSNPQLRYNEDNCHKQCSACNNHLSGNPIEYRINLIKKIGIERVEFLEQDHQPKKYTIPELILLKENYKEKIRKLKKD